MTKFEQTGLTAPFTAQNLSPYNESSLAEGYTDYMVIAGDGESIVCDRMTETVANLIADLLNTRAASAPDQSETIKVMKEALEKSNQHLERILSDSIKNDSDHAPSPLSNQILSNREVLALAEKGGV